MLSRSPRLRDKGAGMQPTAHLEGRLSLALTGASGGPLELPTGALRAAARVRQPMHWGVLASSLSLRGPQVLSGQLLSAPELSQPGTQ